MITLKFDCESTEQANIYLNAQGYYNLIYDFYNAVRSARKHGTDTEIVKVVELFYSQFSDSIDHNQGPY